ncbi:MAG: sulfurtransferase-like selenium metabolism protein YedF [Lachnospiraceae bacterium]|nr:sulfurtransferase-like selenium metabolism protein YedF [Candidatus Equihabitans merdae]
MMVLNCKGKPCPEPVVLSIKALKELAAGEVLEVIVDNAAAVENVSRMADSKKCTVAKTDNGDGTWTLALTPTDAAALGGEAAAEAEAAVFCNIPAKRTLVVAVGTDEMGQGDATLGRNLAKAFVYALAQQEELPATILFFNGGAKLTVEGSPALADLQDMAERGVEILTCGTCLDFYGIKEKLAVGGVTNMYTIVEKMSKAGHLIRI